MSQTPEPSATTPDNDPTKKSPWRTIAKWLLVIHLTASIVLTAVQIVVFDVAAEALNYEGASKYVGMFILGGAAFASSLFTVTIWMAIILFAICFLGFVIFVLPHWIKAMKQPRSSTAQDNNSSTTPDDKA